MSDPAMWQAPWDHGRQPAPPRGPVQHISDEQRARIGLSRVFEPDDDAARHLIEAQGAPAVWDAVTGGPLLLPPDLAARARARRPDASEPDRDLERAATAGARVVFPGDDEWPPQLADLGRGAPLCLWLRGAVPLDLAVARAVAVVGSRAATGYGTHVAGELAHGLAEAGYTVVSGAAYGIDGAAHRGALAGGGVTVAVLACGVDVPYPRGHDTLLRRIADDGLVVSEWPPGCAPLAYRFLTRNRLIAALTLGTVVVEAAARSGALRTASDASGLGRQLMAVPGPVTSTMSVGAHRVLRDMDGRCVTSAADIDALLGGLQSTEPAPDRGPDRARDRLGALPRRVLEAVPVVRAQPPVRIARTCGLELIEVRRLLGALLLDGFVERTDGGFRLSTAERQARRTARNSRSGVEGGGEGSEGADILDATAGGAA